MRAHAHWSIAYALRAMLQSAFSTSMNCSAPVVAHNDSDSVALLHAHANETAGESQDMLVHFAKRPGEVPFDAQVGMSAHGPAVRPGLLSATYKPGAVCMLW